MNRFELVFCLSCFLLMLGGILGLVGLIAHLTRRSPRGSAAVAASSRANKRSASDRSGAAGEPPDGAKADGAAMEQMIDFWREALFGFPRERWAPLMEDLLWELRQRNALDADERERLQVLLEFSAADVPAADEPAADEPAADEPAPNEAGSPLVPLVDRAVGDGHSGGDALLDQGLAVGSVEPSAQGSVPMAAVPGEVRVGESVALRPAAARGIQQPAPWDMPDPPARPPRQTLAQWSQGFMEERNIRWGELASGLLIVGSAMGLVLSLRRELQDTIPYFPALLFLSISWAIHYAGLYTLSRWRLRSTSRGLLLISLLLVPLNFLAGVLFSADQETQRPLTDPWFWMAIAVGSTGLGWITWSAARVLLRKGPLALFAPVMVVGLGLVAVNRLPLDGLATYRGLTFLPMAIAAAWPLVLLGWRFARRRRLSLSSLTRAWLVGGVGFYSLGAAMGLYFLREPEQPQLLSSLVPALAIWVLARLWCVLNQDGLLKRGAGLGPWLWVLIERGVLGFALIVMAAWTVRCPRDLLLISLLYAGAAGAAAWMYRRYVFIPLTLVWAVTAIVVSRGLAVGLVQWSEMASAADLAALMINGRSAIVWLLAGGVLAAASPWLRGFLVEGDTTTGLEANGTRRPIVRPTAGQIHRWNSWCGMGFVACGALLALVAAYMPTADQWDAMLGTSLLYCVALFVVGSAVWGGHHPRGQVALTIIGTGLLLAAGMEASFGNRYLVPWLAEAQVGTLSRVVWVALITVGVLVLADGLPGRPREVGSEVGSQLAVGRAAGGWSPFSLGAIWVGLVGESVSLLALINESYSWASATGGSGLAALTIGAALRHAGQRPAWFQWCSLLGVTFLVGLFYQANGERSGMLGTAQFFYAWTLVVAVWWVVGRAVGDRRGGSLRRATAVAPWPLPTDLMAVGVPLSLGAVAVVGLLRPMQREIWAVAPEWLPQAWQLPAAVDWATAALLAWIALACAWVWAGVRSAAKSNKSSGIAVGIFLAISLYTVLWAVQGARWDVDLRAATAMRWLVTLGALIPAVLGVLAMVGFPARRPFTCAGKNGIGFGGGWGEVARANRFVQLWAVDWSVATSVMAVFAITALAISGFLLVGPEVGGISPRATWFGRLRTDVSYGVPIAGLLAVVLLHGICYRQRGLVIAGSYLLRLIVVFQLVLLALSPHPRLATEWFVHIVQMVSAGMTVYGWVWYVFRRRCRTPFSGRGLFQPIQTHTLFNGALLGGLVALVIGKYLWAPNESLGWIQAVGNSVGLGTTLIYLPLFWLVYLRRSSRTWFLPLTLWGLVAVTLAVVSLERGWGLAPGRPLVILGWGWVGLAGLMAIYHGLLPRDVLHRRDLWREDVRVLAAGWRRSNLWDVTAGWALVSGLIVCLAWRGFGAQAPQFWQFYSLLATLWIVGLAIGGLRQSVAVPFWLLLLACGLVWQVTDNPPQRILPSFLDRSIVLYGLAALLIGGVWLGSYLVQRYGWRWRGERGSLAFGRLALLSCLWILAGCVVFRTSHVLLPAECLLLLCCGLYGLAALWCDREPWRVTPGALILGISASSLICSLAARSPVGWLYRDVALLLAGGIVVLLWGLGLRSLPGLVAGLRQLGVPRIAAWRAAHVRWLPIWGGLLAGVLVGSAMLLQGFSGDRLERQLACFAPLCAAVGFVWFANRVGRQWQRYAAIALFTATGLLLSWTTVPVGERWFWGTLVQTHWAMGLGFIAYGFGVAQGLRQADSWRIAIQRSASVLLMVSIVCLGLILLIELQTWADQRYQRATTTEAGLIAGMTLALAIAMVVIALVPRHQATALSMAQRQAYVYGAQLLLAALVAHAAVAMPWLWGLGLRQYWPYLAMGLSFGGIGVWRVLERRQLTVLADPLATSLFFLPAVAALLSLGFESQADRAVVMLLGGMVYGGLAMTHPGFWTRAGAFAFGNLALWLFIQKYPAWSFQQHPQLWLIPPAVTALVISRWEQDRLDPRAAASLRYISLAVIYVSSTSEIFIHGLGTHLAPPMILATLAVLGMLVGMSLKIREYIYLGALFLLVAMFTMVSHAQQQLNHVWPWWAFGISLGIATMVFFGVFEQHRNQRRRQLRGLNGTPEKGPEEGPAEDGVDPIGGRSADADAAADGRNA